MCGCGRWQAEGANALAQLTHANGDNQRTVARMGGITMLATLVGASDLYVKEMGALALTETTRANRDNQTLAAEAGTLASLVELLKDTKSGEVRVDSLRPPKLAGGDRREQRPRRRCSARGLQLPDLTWLDLT
jgi:hypothetical protein